MIETLRMLVVVIGVLGCWRVANAFDENKNLQATIMIVVLLALLAALLFAPGFKVT